MVEMRTFGAAVWVVVFLAACSTKAPPVQGSPQCGSASGTATLQAAIGTVSLPINGCLGYWVGGDRAGVAFCATKESPCTSGSSCLGVSGPDASTGEAVSQQVCVLVDMAVSSSSTASSFTMQPWPWGSYYTDGNGPFLTAQLTAGNAYVDVEGVASANVQASDFPGAGGGTLQISSTCTGCQSSGLPIYVGDTGSAHIEGQGIALASGATLSFSADVGLSAVAAPSGGSGSSSGASSSGASSGAGSSGAGSCSASTSATCQTLTDQCSEDPTSQAPCYCAAACDCKCAGDSSCEQQNLASAQQLGTTCQY